MSMIPSSPFFSLHEQGKRFSLISVIDFSRDLLYFSFSANSKAIFPGEEILFSY